MSDAAAAIRNAAWMVRHYRRPGQKLQRAQAIQRLGAEIRRAFASCEPDAYELLLDAILEGLEPQTHSRRF